MINLQAISPLIARGELILTPNNRMKNKLLLHWAQARTGISQAPKVFSLGDWIDRQWRKAQRQHPELATQTLASTLVRRQLWAQALKASEATDPLVHPRLLIDQLDQAYSYLRMWQVRQSDWAAYGSPDEQARLQGWISAVETALADRDLLTEEQRLVHLLSFLNTQSEPQVRAYLLNFDTLTPLHEQLLCASFQALEPLNSNQTPAQSATRVICRDPKHELMAVAHWAHCTLANNPNQQIAIVDPNLGKNRARLERHLARVFEASHHLPHTPRFTMPFNFSAGTPLAQCPVVHQLLASLRWPKSPDQCLAWLNSPFIGHAQDQHARQWVGSRLLEAGLTDIRLQDVGQLFEQLHQQQSTLPSADSGYQDPAALTYWHAYFVELANWPAQATGRQWADIILAALTQLNWPGPRALDSEEHQQVSQLLQLLPQLAEADHLGAPLSAREATQWLSELASRQPFQPQTPESPLQILGTLESAGLAFDQIWVLGMDDTQWPPAASPNPLLPAQMQRDLQMPHASAERELAFCQRITQNLLSAANRVIFSHPARDGDRELSASPLIAQLACEPAPKVPEATQPIAAFEWLETLTAPPVDAIELTSLRGGSGMLQKQARCPLAAFMEIRLGARRPETAQPGLNALDRGTLLHQALFYFWRAKPALQAMDEQAIAQALDHALDQACQELPSLANTRFMALERQRLRHLLQPWLAFERERPPFSVQGLEQSISFTLGSLPLTLRLDRIDNIDGQWLLIDYKSGRTHLNSWLGDRPEEPQLPLYAVALSDAGEPVAAIAFAELRQKNQLLQGIGNPDLTPGLKPPSDRQINHDEWPALVAHWRHALHTLAQELIHGHCPLAFSSPQSAQYLSHLNPLLRTAEQGQLALARTSSTANVRQEATQ